MKKNSNFVLISCLSLLIVVFSILSFQQQVFSDEIIPALTINSEGNVGIGIMDSKYNLHVTGNAGFGSTGNVDFISKFGSSGTGDGQFNLPTGITVHQNGDVYVVDYGNHRVQVFDSEGVYKSQFGSFGTGDGQFNLPAGITVHQNGDVYVADRVNHRVQVFDSEGVYKSQFGSFGTGDDSQFNYPLGITVHQNGDVYVADRVNHRVQIFSPIPVLLVNNNNVGIGTTSPDETLDNNGNLIVRPEFSIWGEGITIARDESSTDFGFISWHNGIGNYDPDESTAKFALGHMAETGNDLTLISAGATGSPLGRADAVMRVTSGTLDTSFGGKVGIGTTSPTEKLSIVEQDDNGYTGLLLQNPTQSTIELRTYGDSSSAWAGAGILTSWNTDVDLGLVADSLTNVNDGTSDHVIWLSASSGNVGIGTTSPDTPLSIIGNGGVYPIGITQNQVGLDATMELTTTDSLGDQATRLLIRGNTDNADIEFYTGKRGSETKTMHIEGSNGNIGIGTTSPSQKLDVNGNAIADSWLTHSSQKWKQDITPLDNTLDKVTQIQGVTYQWRADEFPDMSFDETATQIGFIAEELEMIYPELVYTTDNGDKSIDYSKLTPILLEAIKEQQNSIEEQQDMINTQQDILEQLKTVICPEHPELSACQ